MTVLDRLSCRNFVVIDGWVYFSNMFYNGFFKTEINTGKTYFLDCFRDEKMSMRNIHRDVFLNHEKIYLCPWKGKHLHIWDPADRSLHSVEIRGERCPFIDEMVLGTKEVFPFPKLMEEWKIPYAEPYFWKQVCDKVWYGFWPLGSYLLRYREGADTYEEIPLTVVNGTELEEHLHKVRVELLQKEPVSENTIELQKFLDEVTRGSMNRKGASRDNSSVGNNIWKQLE
jgi:hypothetical protein